MQVHATAFRRCAVGKAGGSKNASGWSSLIRLSVRQISGRQLFRTFGAGSNDKILCSPKLEIQSCYYHFIDQIFLV